MPRQRQRALHGGDQQSQDRSRLRRGSRSRRFRPVRVRQGTQVIAASVPVTHIAVPSIDWYAIAPDIAIFAAALCIVLLRSLVRHHPRVHEASLVIAIAGVATSAVFTAVQWTFV